jgi:hypothetical protein
LISEITAMDDEQELAELEQHVRMLRARRKFSDFIKPMAEDVTIEALKEEQHYQPIDEAEFEALVNELDIPEAIEELLEMLD